MKRLNCLLFVLTCCLLYASAAGAQDWGKVVTPDRPLNVRSGRTLQSKRLTTIMPGERVRLDYEKGDWAAIFDMSVTERNENNALGYVKTKYMVPAKADAATTWGQVVAPKGMLNIREKRSRSSEHMLTLRAGEAVKVDFEKDGWVAVFQAGELVRDEKRALGYARAKYLFPVQPQASAAAIPTATATTPEGADVASGGSDVLAEPVASKPVGSSVTAKVNSTPVTVAASVPDAELWGRVVTLKRRANVRSGRTAASNLVSTLKEGDKVRVDFLERGWYAVFRQAETKRDEKRALGYVYASLLGEPAVELKPSTLRPTPAPQPEVEESMETTAEPVAVTPEPREPVATVAQPSAGVQPSLSDVKHIDGKDKMTITPVDVTPEPNKGPEPRADKVRHGFKYGIIERTAGTKGAAGRLLVKVYLELSVIPEDAALKDFATTVFNDEKGDSKEVLLLVYLPGQDVKDLAYAQAKFDSEGMVEFWARRSTLYGTRFMP